MSICGIVPPRREGVVGHRSDNYLGECILEKAHLPPHLIKTPEGKYIEWEDDPNCGCCEPGEDDCCYLYSEVTEERAGQLLQKRG